MNKPIKFEFGHDELYKFLLNVFCTCDWGLSVGIRRYNPEDFQLTSVTREDKWVEHLQKGGLIMFFDQEEADKDYKRLMSIDDIIESINKNVPPNYFFRFADDELGGELDAFDAYNVIQYIAYGEVIFG
jgi:hypothetical protein